jgi:hypothetical protein
MQDWVFRLGVKLCIDIKGDEKNLKLSQHLQPKEAPNNAPNKAPRIIEPKNKTNN